MIEINNINDLRKAHPSLNISWNAWIGEEPWKITHHINNIESNVPLKIWYSNTKKIYTLMDDTPFIVNLMSIKNIDLSIIYGEVFFNKYKIRYTPKDILDIHEIKKHYNMFKPKESDRKIIKIVKKYVQSKLVEGISRNAYDLATGNTDF